MNPDPEIPQAVAEYWPRLRFFFERECLELCKEERERTPQQPDYQMIGIASVTCSKLLERIDRLMGQVGADPAPARPRAAALKTTTFEQK